MSAPRSGAFARWIGALPALGLAAACTPQPVEWPGILTQVRERYPDVPLVSVTELETRLTAERPLLLDARGKDEFAVSHLEDAIWAPDEEHALRALAGAPAEREVVVYCSVGMRSGALARSLRKRGFAHVSNLEGGIFAWANAGLPTYRGTEREDRVHPYDARWGALLVPGRRAP